MLAAAGVIGLIWKIKLADVALRQAASIGAWMTVIALTSGAIWGRPTWGTYWVWDARLTSMLILLFLYLGLIALGRSEEHTSELQSLMRISYAVFCLKKKKTKHIMTKENS